MTTKEFYKIETMIGDGCIRFDTSKGFFFANFGLKDGFSYSEDMDKLLEEESIDQQQYDNIMDYMTQYMKEMYVSAYIDRIDLLVDGYDEEQDRSSGSPWCTQSLYDDMTLDMIGYKAYTAAEKDAPALAGFIDEDESNLGHDGVFYITLNCGIMYKDYVTEKKIVCRKGKDYQKIYTSLSLECEALKKAGHTYFIDTELLDQIEITAMNFQEVLEEIDGHVDPDLYAASYALDSLDKNDEAYTEDGIEYHLDYLFEHSATFDKIQASLIAENFVGLR
ncbi:MAG: hypothetical protein EOM67_10135 [Spirochaetia bacterium]|nr:hypothetical protein [Spirochaetia bacterium]